MGGSAGEEMMMLEVFERELFGPGLRLDALLRQMPFSDTQEKKSYCL